MGNAIIRITVIGWLVSNDTVTDRSQILSGVGLLVAGEYGRKHDFHHLAPRKLKTASEEKWLDWPIVVSKSRNALLPFLYQLRKTPKFASGQQKVPSTSWLSHR
jgi:hypothetical protein